MVDTQLVRDNWRVILLTLMIVASGVALFAPPDTIGVDEDQVAGPTNLQYGLELDGGTRIRAPVVGMHVSNVPAEDVQISDVQDELESLEGVETADFRVARGEPGTITAELYVNESVVNRSQFAGALRAAGLEVQASDVRRGVTDETRDEIVQTIDDKISRSGFGGTSVSQAQSGGNSFVVIEAPNRDPAEIRDIVERRGQVEIVAHYPADGDPQGEYVNETVLNSSQLERARVGVAQSDQERGQTYVPITLGSEADARSYVNTLEDAGYTTRGVGNCRWRGGESRPEAPGWCLLTVVDGEVVYSASVAPGLAQTIRSGSFVQEPSFRMITTNISEARDLQIDLRAGSLRSQLDWDEDQVFTISPALAEGFKLNSLITGIVAVIAVSLVVYFRYGDAKVAAPMVVTALSEVVILLGFAAIVKLQLDLSHIAGFIAVIGTGVDDLIIIADEVMSEGEVNSSRVFQNRFRKAFWVIGAAAATTIIAMSPLAFLQLGDLRGFAIITILGVLVGVLVTRPAYGDILDNLLTGR